MNSEKSIKQQLKESTQLLQAYSSRQEDLDMGRQSLISIEKSLQRRLKKKYRKDEKRRVYIQ